MLHGYGPAILNAVPKDRSATVREIQAAVSRTPELATVRRHISQLVAMGCLMREGDGYRRLVDSEFDVEAGVAA